MPTDTKGCHLMASYTEEELKAMRLPELKTIAKDLDINIAGMAKNGIIEAIADYEEPDEDLAEDDEDIEEDVEEDVEEEADEADDEELDDEELDEEELDEIEAEAPKPTKAKAKTVRKEPTKKASQEAGDTLAAKQVATELGTEAKTLRQFFRSDASTVEAVGSGGRYEFAREDLGKIKTEFEAWKAGHAGRGKGRSKAKDKADEAANAPVVDEVDEIEELEDEDLDEELNDEDLELEEDED